MQSESESPADSSSAKTVEQLHSSEVWTPSLQLIRKTCATGDTSGVECFIYWENFTNLWNSERLSGWVSLSVAMFSKSRVSSLEFVFGPCLSVYPQPHHKKVQLAAAFVQSESESPAHSSSAKTVEQLHSSEVWTPSLQLIRKTCVTRDTSGVLCKNEKTLQICEILSSWAAECSYVFKVSSLEFVFGPCLSVYPQPHHNWPSQEPKLEVPTIYKTYIRPM